VGCERDDTRALVGLADKSFHTRTQARTHTLGVWGARTEFSQRRQRFHHTVTHTHTHTVNSEFVPERARVRERESVRWYWCRAALVCIHTRRVSGNECEEHWKKKEKQTTRNIFHFFLCSLVVFVSFSSSRRFKVSIAEIFCVVSARAFLIFPGLHKNRKIFLRKYEIRENVVENLKKFPAKFWPVFKFLQHNRLPRTKFLNILWNFAEFRFSTIYFSHFPAILEKSHKLFRNTKTKKFQSACVNRSPSQKCFCFSVTAAGR